ncbi:MAG TPA: PrsW family glutamic-type intramembrane protease [Galbitalea sp.]|jgi:RsiW-degrading membrane proteinase PrsW (M82 family)
MSHVLPPLPPTAEPVGPQPLPDWGPPPQALLAPVKPPRKWWGPRGGLIVAAVLVAIWLVIVISEHLLDGGPGDTPTAVLLGGFTIATAFLYTMAYRLRPEDEISVVRLIVAFVAGGLMSTLVAAPLNTAIHHFTTPVVPTVTPSLVDHSTAGIVEELCKILAVVVVARGLAAKNARTGLFIGGAVGFGFAAFEDMDYGVRAAHLAFGSDGFGSYIEVVVTRGVLGPMEHPVFTALFAAALFAATRNGRYRITIGVIGAYLGVAAVHGLLDASGDYLTLLWHNVRLGAGIGEAISIALAIGSGVTWLIVTRRLRARDRSRLPPPQFYPAAPPPPPSWPAP